MHFTAMYYESDVITCDNDVTIALFISCSRGLINCMYV